MVLKNCQSIIDPLVFPMFWQLFILCHNLKITSSRTAPIYDLALRTKWNEAIEKSAIPKSIENSIELKSWKCMLFQFLAKIKNNLTSHSSYIWHCFMEEMKWNHYILTELWPVQNCKNTKVHSRGKGTDWFNDTRSSYEPYSVFQCYSNHIGTSFLFPGTLWP